MTTERLDVKNRKHNQSMEVNYKIEKKTSAYKSLNWKVGQKLKVNQKENNYGRILKPY